MALTARTLYKKCHILENITKQMKSCVGKRYFVRPITYRIGNSKYSNNINSSSASVGLLRPPFQYKTITSENEKSNSPNEKVEPAKRPGLVQRFKEMYRDYWYVLLPVHMATSAVWFGGFYYLIRSGVDVLGILESTGISERFLIPFREHEAGYLALTLALYKLATPLRYAVTLGGTTYAIKKLTALGWIRPVPTKERLKEMIQEKKDNFQDKISESKSYMQVKEKGTQVMDEMRRYKEEMRNMKNRMRKM